MTAEQDVDVTDGAALEGSDGSLVMDDLVVEYATGVERVRPVDGFSATIPDGSLALLLGPSGCGKTTLLSCLAGILEPTAGTIRHGARSITGLRGAELMDFRRHGVGIVFQAFNLIPSLTALENVMLPMRSAGVARATARTRATELLEQLDLGARAGFVPARMSGGQQQRVAIARALAMDPPLILADEPTAHLDYVQVEVTLRTLRRLATPGRVVVVVTHDERLLPLADQIIELVPHATPRAGRESVSVALTAGQVLFRRGDVSDLVYRIEQGEVEVLRPLESAEAEAAGVVDFDATREVRIATLTSGQIVGEMGPLFGLPRSATIRALKPSLLTAFTVEALRDELGVERLDLLMRGGRSAPLGKGHPRPND
ncbi:MAG TPA: ATP-binding cassette domain-containing protein [Microthrixaceae bacterium]|nr:ATP-binding cassette domain-containing protein [Microthrixaceae bacterium]